MRILHLNEDIYDEVIASLQRQNKQVHADLLIQIKNQARVVDSDISAETHRSDGELTAPQKEALRILHAGGSIRSLRWSDIVFCCTYHDGKFKNIDTSEVTGLLSKGIIDGVQQSYFPDKEYVFTEFGRIVAV